jgi:hypothetical protein
MSGQSEWIEETCDAMIAKLEAQIAARIAAVNAESTDYQIDGPTGITLGERSEPTYPWITVSPSRTGPDLDTGERIVYAHTIEVISVYWDPDEDALMRKLLRFARAVREVMLDKRQPGITLGDGGWGLQFLGDSYSRMITVESGSFIKAVTSTFYVKQQQTI